MKFTVEQPVTREVFERADIADQTRAIDNLRMGMAVLMSGRTPKNGITFDYRDEGDRIIFTATQEAEDDEPL